MSNRFLNSAFAQGVMPFATSVAIHAGILLLGALMIQSLVVFNGAPGELQAVTPDVQMVTADLPAGISDAYLGVGERPLDPARQDVEPDAPLDATGFGERETGGFDLAEPDDAKHDVRQPAAGLIGRGDVTHPSDFGDYGATGGPRGTGSLAPFGAPRGGVPTGSIFADKVAVRSVAFVCDASGSMIDKFEPLRQQISRQVAALTPVQSFNVIFFQDERVAALGKTDLLHGVTDHKRRAEQFLREMTPAGPTDPLPALALALRQKPELIWLLTDGDFPDNAAVLDLLRRQNPGGRVRINTIAFVERGEQYERVLRTIAAENRGTFRYVSAAEVD